MEKPKPNLEMQEEKRTLFSKKRQLKHQYPDSNHFSLFFNKSKLFFSMFTLIKNFSLNLVLMCLS